MNKRLSFILSIFLLLIILTSLFVIQPMSTANAAAIGDILTSPDSGFKRIEQTDVNITYEGANWVITGQDPPTSGGSVAYALPYEGQRIKFNYVGSEIRIITTRSDSRNNNDYIIIDGTTYTYSEKGTVQHQTLVFQAGLPLKEHCIEMYSSGTSYFSLDAIDIDSIGEIKLYNPNPATPTPVSTSTPTETPTPTLVPTATPIPGGDRALLTITLSNGTEKEYDMTAQEIAGFKTWYSNRAAGTGEAFYEIAKTYNKGPFVNRKDCIVFDKIVSFEISDYYSN